MTGLAAGVREVAALRVARVGWVAETLDPLRPFVVLDENGAEVAAVTEFLHHTLVDDASPARRRTAGFAARRAGWSRTAG